jgi:hypothetical protein
LFFGHTHTDDFRIVWEGLKFPWNFFNFWNFSGPSMNHPIAAFLIAPSITPFYVNNPGFKKYHYDTLSAVPIDYEAHFMDLFVSNRQKQSNWQLEYQFSTAYGVCRFSLSNLLQSLPLECFRFRTVAFILHCFFEWLFVSYEVSHWICVEFSWLLLQHHSSSRF